MKSAFLSAHITIMTFMYVLASKAGAFFKSIYLCKVRWEFHFKKVDIEQVWVSNTNYGHSEILICSYRVINC